MTRLSPAGIIVRAVAWHRNSYMALAMVVTLIAAVITASLLAGASVRETLKQNTVERLNGSSIMISAGLRYSDRDVATALSGKLGVTVAPLMEVNGRVSSFGSELSVSGIKAWGVDTSFFKMGGYDTSTEMPGRGEAIINGRLADALQIAEGDFVILRFAPPSDIPNHTPFAPAKEEDGSLFLSVRKIVRDEGYALFNPAISQVIPYNIFVGIDEFNRFLQDRPKANRFMVARESSIGIAEAEEALAGVTFPGGQSLRFRTVKTTGETEIISDRIFIDEFIVREVTGAIPEARPVLTYLANNIASASGATPYSFIAAIPGSTDGMPDQPFDMLVNEWLAADLGCSAGDSVTVTYYLTGSDNRLREDSARFRMAAVVPLGGVWRDSMLMPEFPGITGSRSCTEWDAGIPLDMKRIRDKDEDYWNDHAGTPKAFIRYETGAALWGNQFGPATAIRLGHGAGSREPVPYAAELIPLIGTYGFVVTDLVSEGLKAATSGVDFSTLFLALSFFIILSALVLLILIADNHLRSREGEMAAYTALGFPRGKIRMLFLGEVTLPVIIGSASGTAAGILFNTIIIKALNSVWIGAVQTDTLRAFTDMVPLLTGFIATAAVALVAVTLRVNAFLRQTGESMRSRMMPDGKATTLILGVVVLMTIATFILIAFTSLNPVMLWFTAGALLLATLVLAVRWMTTRRFRSHILSLRYYAFHPARAVTPVLFIAAGLFTVISTGANRQDFGRNAMKRSSGTGGFTYWIETSIPVEPAAELPAYWSAMRCLRVEGDDASCLNLNLITSPHLLGVDAATMAERGSFSFASMMKDVPCDSPWEVLNITASEDAIYGFLDQTVMQWGMKLKTGDTVTIRSESGRPLHVIIAGGFKTSIFQGYLVIGKNHFPEWFPSVSGSTVILADTTFSPYQNQAADELSTSGSKSQIITDPKASSPEAELKVNLTSDIPSLEPYGAIVETTSSRLQSFYRVTNTYLSVFTVLGAIGMILGVTGMGLNLLRNMRSRRHELALLAATGFTTATLKRMLLTENLVILTAGVIAGTLPAVIATWPSLGAGNNLPWTTVGGVAMLMLLAGSVATAIAVRTLTREKIVTALREGR